MDDRNNETMRFQIPTDKSDLIKNVIKDVYKALENKGYNPKNQIIGYILSGDPTYITSHENARSIIRQVERDEILGELLDCFLENK